MPKRFKLQDYEVEYKESKQQACVLITGEKIYYDILSDAYPNRCNAVFPDRNHKYDWGVYINCTETEAQEIDNLLKMFTYAVCLQDELHQSFALDYYYEPYWDDPEGGLTLAGSLVNQAKYYPAGTPEHTKQLDKLLDYFSRFITKHPSYHRSDFLVAMPFYDEKDFDLPTTLTERLCSNLGIMNGSPYVAKIRETKPMKSLETKEEKLLNIKDAFSVSSNAPFDGKRITIIDDVYRSGATIEELSRTLRKAGAVVQGIIAAKTIRD
jgi:competence protein ComFC